MVIFMQIKVIDDLVSTGYKVSVQKIEINAARPVRDSYQVAVYSKIPGSTEPQGARIREENHPLFGKDQRPDVAVTLDYIVPGGSMDYVVQVREDKMRILGYERVQQFTVGSDRSSATQQLPSDIRNVFRAVANEIGEKGYIGDATLTDLRFEEEVKALSNPVRYMTVLGLEKGALEILKKRG
jgi:hypothetical protein